MTRTNTWGPTADLIDALDAAGYGYGPATSREERDRVKSTRLATAVVQVVNLPDGTVAKRQTHRPALFVVAVHTPDGWQVFRWVTSERDLPQAIARASETYHETQTLEVKTP